MSEQIWALALVAAVVVAAAGLEVVRSRRARRLSAGATATPTIPSVEPYILYFTGDSCSVCKTHQEPALARLVDVRIDKVDAVAERSLADQFHVYTLPTTVVMAPDGHALHVNYGYATTGKLERQLAEARNSSLRTATA